jgi:hypothetical protein
MSWRITVRAGPRVERERRETLPDALELLERRARQAAMRPRMEAVDVPFRRFEPADLVAARFELRGPQRLAPEVRAGVDVRGDGSVVAWTGGRRREAVEPADGEGPFDALRRALAPLDR